MADILLRPETAGSGGSGDVVGPASSTDNAVVRWDGATGKLIQNSSAILGDDGSLILTSSAAAALAVGPNGNTNPVLRVVGNVAGAATGLSITGNASGTAPALAPLSPSASEALKITGKGTNGFVQMGPDTYGAAGWSGYNIALEIVRLAATEPFNYTIYAEGYVGDFSGANGYGIYFLAGTQGAGAANNVGSIYGLWGDASSSLPAGRTATLLLGVYGHAFASSAGTVTTGIGVRASVERFGTSQIATGKGLDILVANLSSSAGTNTGYGINIAFTNSTTHQNSYGIRIENMVGKATNTSPFWYDGTGSNAGVSLINELGQLHYYNPAVTAFTPGAANYERIVTKWTSSVAEIGTEAGGTGTQRPLRLLGSDIEIATGKLQFLGSTSSFPALKRSSAELQVRLADDSAYANFRMAAPGFFGTAPPAQQVSGANLTNNVTAGGVNDTIADFTDLTTYANDAATIRNDIYQLSRKLKQINDGLRAYGLFT